MIFLSLMTLIPRILPTLTDHLPGDFLSPPVREVRVKLREALSRIPPSAAQLIRENVVFTPEEVCIRAGLTYPDHWLRDQLLSSLALNDPTVEYYLLSNFLERQNDKGQLPTVRYFYSNRAFYFNDESTMLGIIWRAKLVKMGVSLSLDETKRWQKALGWVSSHDRDSLYVTPSGSERSWFDTFIFEKDDASSYNHGIYIDCLLSAAQMGLKLRPNQIQEAMNAYKKLEAPSGRLRFSMNYPYKDTSCLMGQFLADHLLGGESLIDDQAIQETVRSLPYEQGGYRVVTQEDDSFLDQSQFNTIQKPGEYQRGGQWLSYSAAAQDTGERHGLPCDSAFWHHHLKITVLTDNAEWVKTGVTPGSWPQYDPRKIRHTQNAGIHALIQKHRPALMS